MNNNEQYMDELRSKLIKIMDSEAKSYGKYAKEIGISVNSLYKFIGSQSLPSRINRIKMEIFIDKRLNHEKSR